ncbi:MAG: hypothetical protein JNM31_01530 [Flavobacteriales bacterium]|nr:hypothetical protein [Flavobacteriales bacterium]
MLRRIADHLRTPAGRDQVLTYLAEGLAMLGMVYAYHLAALFGTQDLDLYVIVRRSVSFLYPVILLGAAVGITRYVAMEHVVERQRAYLRGSLTWVLPLAVLVLLPCLLFADTVSWLLFGDADHGELVPPLGLMIVAVALHGLAYSYLRGRGRSLLANTLQFVNLGLMPCVAFWSFARLEDVVWFTGGSWTFFSALIIVPVLFKPFAAQQRHLRTELLRYGLPRVPGELAFGALLTVPVYFAARTHGLAVSGQVGFGATLLNLAAAVFAPVSLLLLPASAARLARGDHAGLAASMSRMVLMVLMACAAMTVGFEALAGPFLDIYLGDAGSEYLAMSRLVFLGALPFGFFIGLRSLLDAYFHTPRNGMNLLKAFLLMLAGGILHLVVPTPWYTMGVVMVVSLIYLGWATWRDVRFVRSELERLSRRSTEGLRIMVVVAARRDHDDHPVAQRQMESFSRTHNAIVSAYYLEDRTSFWRLLADRRRFKKALRLHRPDVVMVHYGSVAALFTVLNSAVPVVVRFSGSDLDRSSVPGPLRAFLGGLFSQLAAFFASGILLAEERLRGLLWWRHTEAHTVVGEDAAADAATFTLLRAQALHMDQGTAG